MVNRNVLDEIGGFSYVRSSAQEDTDLGKEIRSAGFSIGLVRVKSPGNAGKAANQTMSELGTNASNAMNKTGEAVNATANELGKNASDIGSTILNKTAEVGKKIIGGVGSVLGNISGEMKKP